MTKQAIIFGILFLVPTCIWAQTYQLNTEVSTFNWTGKAAFNAYSLSGTLQAASGMLDLNGNQIEAGHITIDMKTLISENKDLEKHLRSKDFFEVKKHKDAEFTFVSMETHDHKTKIIGNLTIKGLTQEVSLLTDLQLLENKAILKGKLVFDRTKFGIKFNSPNYFENLKDQAIADQVTLVLDLVFDR